ncbi:DNA glycosylase superfamily protein [Zea mays]|uniref:DNA glycosylase superfamily protein n=1 Tax=Zea mays TaxID=4577 RepID=A0A1D6JSA4_MAIZE|nr:DNA glycosylase superfamily protein [Zea mays]ONL94795.1 DNA glycosylase superfamily protein [Zea mays]
MDVFGRKKCILHFPTKISYIFQCNNLPIQPERFLFCGLQIGRNCGHLLRKNCFLLGEWKIPPCFIGLR